MSTPLYAPGDVFFTPSGTELSTQNLIAEQLWWHTNPWLRPKHLLMRWPFVHPARQKRAYEVARANTRSALIELLDGTPVNRGLVAPCGDFADQDILKGLAREWHGIDVSPAAVSDCNKNHPEVQSKVGDILSSEYARESFDLVASMLFFHHLHKVGFAPFLREFHRVLRPGGVLAILEPSSLSPFAVATLAGKTVFGNVSGLVPDEAPIRPSRLTEAVEQAGFRMERFEGVSFAHNRLPVPAQRILELITPGLSKTVAAHAAWMCVWLCRKI